MPLTILLLTHKFYPDIGGIETLSEILADSFTDAGYTVKVVTWTKSSGNKEFPYTIIRNPGFLRLIKEHATADITFENNPCLRLAWPSLLFRKPSIVGLHTWITKSNGKVGWEERVKLFWLKRAKTVIACSNAIRQRCWPPAVVIGNPYQDKVFRIIPQIQKTVDFIFVGRLVSDKGVDLAIKAIEIINSESVVNNNSRPFSLTIIGEGPEKARLMNLVRTLKLEKLVTFAGALKGEDLVRMLNKHKYILIPSVWEEPFGMVALEGMACGCLPIVSNGGGLLDAIGSAGLSFQRGDVRALVNVIKQLIDDPLLEERLKAAAVNQISAHSTSVIATQYLKEVLNVKR